MVKLPFTVARERTIRDSPAWCARREAQQAWYGRNREEVLANVADWQRRNADRVAANSRAYRARDPHRARAIVAKSKRRPGYRQAERAARRAGDIETPEARVYVAVLVGDPCCYCGAAMEHVDHIVPIAAGGNGAWENLTAACAPCNRSKHARSLLVFLAEVR